MPELEPPRFVDGRPMLIAGIARRRSDSGYLEIWIPVESTST